MNYKFLLNCVFLLLLSSKINAQNRSDKLREIAENYFDVDNKKALLFYEKAIIEAKKTNDYVRVSNLCIDISSLYHSQSLYQKALQKCKEGFVFYGQSKTKPDTLLFKLYSSTGTMYKNLSNRDSTKFYYNLANELLKKNTKIEHTIPEYVLHHFNSYGRWLENAGDYFNGVVFIESALTIAHKYKLTYDENIIRTSLAGIYEKLENYNKALNYRKIALNNHHQNNQLMCYNLSGYGWVLILSDKAQEGIPYLLKALNLYNKLSKEDKGSQNFVLHSALLYNLGVGYLKLGNNDEANKNFEQLIKDFEHKRITKSPLLSKAWLRISELYKGNPKKQISFIQNALKTINKNFDSNDISQNPVVTNTINEKIFIEALTQKTKTLFEIYKQTKENRYLDLSCKTINTCLAVMANMRGSFDNATSKLFFNTSIYPFFQIASEIAFQKYQVSNSNLDKEFVFKVIESSKSTALNDAIFDASIKPGFIPNNLLEEEQLLNKKINAIENLSIIDSTKLAALQKLEIEKHNLIRLFESKYPKYYQLKYENRSISTKQIQGNLDKKRAYLSYFLIKDKLFIAIITKEKFEIEAVTLNNDVFLQNAQTFRDKLYQNPGIGNYDGLELSAYFYNILISPIQKYLYDKTSLLVCRESQLNFLPLGVLESGKFINDYLIKKYSIGYTYSAEIFLNKPKPVNNTQVLAIAPFDDKKYNLDSDFKYLPDSEKQALAVADNAMIGTQATKDAFLQIYQQYGIIYFATHSEMNDVNPKQSFIAFNPNENFKLFIDEISNLELKNTKLVVLSACKAGIGQMHQSEGMLSLARAFSYAGCPSIATTLWATNDASSAYLTERFHYHLKSGLDKDVALQKAKIDFLESDFGKRFNHPHFWGNMILIGEEGSVFVNLYKKITLYSFIIISLAVIFFSVKRIKS